jgi:hypothetical protein
VKDFPQEEIRAALADYVRVFESGTSQAADRPRLNQHLASAAQMFATIEKKDRKAFLALLESESRSYGRDFLAGEEGARIEKAWNDFRTQCRLTTDED